MAMTMTEKILARAGGRDSVRPGEIVLAKIDFAMGHDLTIPPAGKIMREQMGADRVWDPDRVAAVQDHFQPAKDVASAALGRSTREFARQMGIKWYFEVGQGGICHTVLPERGLVLPGECVVGTWARSVLGRNGGRGRNRRAAESLATRQAGAGLWVGPIDAGARLELARQPAARSDRADHRGFAVQSGGYP